MNIPPPTVDLGCEGIPEELQGEILRNMSTGFLAERDRANAAERERDEARATIGKAIASIDGVDFADGLHFRDVRDNSTPDELRQLLLGVGMRLVAAESENARLKHANDALIFGYRSALMNLISRIGPARRADDVRAELQRMHDSSNAWIDQSPEKENVRLLALLRRVIKLPIMDNDQLLLAYEINAALAAKGTVWNKITQGEGETGMYLVAFFHQLENRINVGIGTCRDGEWRQGCFDFPIAWMPLPEPPTLASLGLEEWAKEKVAEWSEPQEQPQ